MEVYLKRTKDYIGEIRNNNFGTLMKIVSARNKSDIDVQFLDEHGYIKRNIKYQAFKKGEVKNPYDKTIFGVGYLGEGKYNTGTSKKRTSEHYVWRGMIERCYSKEFEYMHPSYFEISSVCNEWHNFQNFGKWYEENKYEVDGRLHIDKDILYPGNKLYSPETCILVPQRINMLFVRHRPNKYGLPEGISLTSTKRYGASYQGKSLGVFETLDEALNQYYITKKEKIVGIANAYRKTIPDKLYQALINYDVTILNKVA